MLNLKTLYFRNLLEDLMKKRTAVGVAVLSFAILFMGIGYVKDGKDKTLSEEQQQEIDEYTEKVATYDEMIEEINTSLSLVDEQIDSLQNYVDNSIYMKLDSQNIQVASAQYGVKTGGNVSNILNSIVLYINEGGLKEDLAGEYTDLEIEAWREIITPSISANVLNISVLHHDAEQAKAIREVVKKKVLAHVPELIKLHGEFSLEQVDESNYTKIDVNVANTQNNSLNNLKNYISNKSDFQNKLISYQNSRKNYIENNEPEQMEALAANRGVTMAVFAVAGAILGVILSCMYFLLKYILDDRLRSQDDLKDSKLKVLGSYSLKKGYVPALDREILDLSILTEQNNYSQVFLNLLCEDDVITKVADEFSQKAAASGLNVQRGANIEDNIDELKSMIAAQCCILFAEAGKTSYAQLERNMSLCEKYGVNLLGCIVVE